MSVATENLNRLVAKCKQLNGYPVSLRSIIPGRGKTATTMRADLKRRAVAVPDVTWDQARGVFIISERQN